MSRHRIVGGLALALLYAAAFVALCYPRSLLFATHLWADLGDGLNGAWGLWWMRKAIVEIHQSPWHTAYFFHPSGVSLHLHALGPWNGLLAIPLAAALEPIAVHNTIVLSSFVLSGLTAFCLAHAVTGSTAGSIVAGYVYAFSGYHFAHTGAHMNVSAIQWLPLFALCWLRLLVRPSTGAALAAALALLGVYLCDYYYFAYCLLAAVVLAVFEARRRRAWTFILQRGHRRALAVFTVTFGLTGGVLLAGLLRAIGGTALLGAHKPRPLSLDLLAPFIPGGHSHWAGLTTWYWKTAGGNVNEDSVFVGLATVVLAACARPRDDGPLARLGPWWAVLILFFILALGPRLHVMGYELPGVLLPYGWLEAVLPLMRLGGVPLRTFVMVTLALAILAAAGVRRLTAAGPRGRWLATALATFVVAETLPGPIPTSAAPRAGFAEYLRTQPGTGALIDVSSPASDPGIEVYLQTVHEKPMAFGYISRQPAVLVAQLEDLRELARAGAHRRLQCEYGFRWVLTNDDAPLDTAARRVGLVTPERTGILHDLERRFGACPAHS